jgi:hypothetical protein
MELKNSNLCIYNVRIYIYGTDYVNFPYGNKPVYTDISYCQKETLAVFNKSRISEAINLDIQTEINSCISKIESLLKNGH